MSKGKYTEEDLVGPRECMTCGCPISYWMHDRSDEGYTHDPVPAPAPTNEVLHERRRAAQICERLATMMENGAGEDGPGHRLRQAARIIRSGEP
jgi:hypothetical protein